MKNLFKYFSIVLIAALVGVNCYIAADNFQLNSDANLLMLSNASADSDEDHSSGRNRTESKLTAQKMVITSVTVSGELEFSIGQIVDSGIKLKGKADAEMKDCYKITCYESGGDVCTETDGWEVCASTGC